MHPILERLEASLRSRPGRAESLEGDPIRAAVALTMRSDRDEPELLLIRRSDREGDPWSGQIALPGGRWSPDDDSLQATALRETQEETGVDIVASGLVLGALDDLRPRTPHLPPIVVTPYVVSIESPPELRLNHEVAEAFWIPWSMLVDPALDRESHVNVRGATWRVSSFVFTERVVWGMTERIIREMIRRARE
jgi:8-oxo-dGTP pyrophosphatase MutT (NUDIX family)